MNNDEKKLFKGLYSNYEYKNTKLLFDKNNFNLSTSYIKK